MRIENYKLFKGEVRKQLILRDWSYDDLSKATGYSKTSLYNMISGGIGSEKIVKAIITALDIPEHMAT